MDLLDDHIHAGVNFYATTQDIMREWQAMGEDTMEFEAAKRDFAAEREAFNAEKKGLLWRVVVAEKTAESKASEILAEEINADCKWLLARGVPLVCSLVIPLFSYVSSYVVCFLVGSLQIANRTVKSDELAKYMFELGEAAFDSGRKEGYGEGRAAAMANEKVYHFELYKMDCSAHYTAKRQEYEFLEFAIVRVVEKLSTKGAAVETLKKALGD
ncbi:hypothetical protein HanPI659440_Chr15g0605621 [Helianthus annuus]|nr:hypothetical protein HanPI659440_Chr15g0605621 [Helianthus annuus]